MKKVTMILVAVFLVSSFLLSGCGGAKTEQSSGTSQPVKEESIANIFAKAKNVPGMSYEYSMATSEGEIKGKVWMAGKKMKSENMIENHKMISIIDGEKMVAYTYNPEENMALKIPMNNAKASKTPDQYTDVDAAKVKVLETTMYDGVKCKVVLFQESEGKAQTKMWVREDYGIPIRVEVTEPNSKPMVMEYKNLKVGPVAESNFNLPEGVQITDMSEMMKQMQKP